MRKVKTSVPYHRAKARVALYFKLHPGERISAGTLADVIWPGHQMSAQGAGGAAARILRKMANERSGALVGRSGRLGMDPLMTDRIDALRERWAVIRADFNDNHSRFHDADDPPIDGSCRECTIVLLADELMALINTPELEDFDRAVPLEAAHQVLRWGIEHDKGKEPMDWFWLIGYLTGKALAAILKGDTAKAKHHVITTAAALRNWHAHIRSGQTLMRPGTDQGHIDG